MASVLFFAQASSSRPCAKKPNHVVGLESTAALMLHVSGSESKTVFDLGSVQAE
jgi:hypothetical protein